MLQIENHGPLITSTNYWGSELEQAGKVFVSVNAGAIRLLVPMSKRELIEEIRQAEYAVLSRGPWVEVGASKAIEMLFEDRSDSPYAIHLTPESFDLLPAEPPKDQEWVLSVWDSKKGRPHKAVERVCHWRRAPKIPWLKPWKEERN